MSRRWSVWLVRRPRPWDFDVVVNDDFHGARVAEIRFKAGTMKLADIIHNEEIDWEETDSAGGSRLGRLTLAAGEGTILAIEREDVKTK